MDSDRKYMKVYTANVDCLQDPSLYGAALKLLAPERAESAGRMKIESGKRLIVGAGLLLNNALSEFGLENGEGKSRLDYSGLRFGKGKNEKPFLTDWPRIHFNLSHSGSQAMCVVSSCEVGCDVEEINLVRAGQILRCLAPGEQEIVKKNEQDFFRIWTLKESILKVTGLGLSVRLDSFEVTLEPLGVRQNLNDRPIYLREYRLGNEDGDKAGYRWSCAAMEDIFPERMIQVDLTKLAL